jgi:uridine kinase
LLVGVVQKYRKTNMADNNTCEVTFSNGTKKQIPRPFVLKSLLSEEDFLVSVKDKENSNTHPAKCSPVVAARVNNYVMNLNQTIQFKKVSVEPVYEFSSLGNEVVRHTTLYMLSMALAKLYPEKYFTAEHHLGFGYLCESHDIVLTEQTVQEIQDYMKELAQQDLPIVETHISHTEAVEYFKSINRPYTVSLLKSLNDPTIWVDVCGGYMDIHTRILGPSSSLITGKFSVKFRDETSFVLNFQPDPYLLSYVYDDGEIAKVYKEANSWGKQACLECVGDINKYIREKKVKELIVSVIQLYLSWL